MNSILKLIEKASSLDKSQNYVLATVLKMDEQSFFKTGTRIIISKEGKWIGQRLNGKHLGILSALINELTLSQKCQYIKIDAEALQKNTTGILLAQLGKIDCLMSPLNLNEQNNPLKVLEKHFYARENNILITLVSGQIDGWNEGETNDLNQFKKTRKKQLPDNIVKAIDEAILESIINESSKLITIFKDSNQYYRFFIEHIKPRPKVIIAARYIEMFPIIDLVKHLNWDITVITKQVELYKNKPIFGLDIHHFDNLKELDIPTDERTAIISMNKNVIYDLQVVRKFITQENAFLGVYGSIEKGIHIKKTLLTESPDLYHKISKLKTPIGLDLGAANIEETAISIIAQLIKVFSKKTMIIPDDGNDFFVKERTLKIK